ncbi:hypothetical protein CABS03_06213 [Colletotrichum abscissum]|uniref:Uncharacterized protein n=1 Tax=Colletotrichum abscissum TaxID=1671311 RepID=A0A9P9X951_9PEZI|nr:hypothetical protein CABS02_10467 [Colletotrichum abscissum]
MKEEYRLRQGLAWDEPKSIRNERRPLRLLIFAAKRVTRTLLSTSTAYLSYLPYLRWVGVPRPPNPPRHAEIVQSDSNNLTAFNKQTSHQRRSISFTRVTATRPSQPQPNSTTAPILHGTPAVPAQQRTCRLVSPATRWSGSPPHTTFRNLTTVQSCSARGTKVLTSSRVDFLPDTPDLSHKHIRKGAESSCHLLSKSRKRALTHPAPPIHGLREHLRITSYRCSQVPAPSSLWIRRGRRLSQPSSVQCGKHFEVE